MDFEVKVKLPADVEGAKAAQTELNNTGDAGEKAGKKVKHAAEEGELSHKQERLAVRDLGEEFGGLWEIVESGEVPWLLLLTTFSLVFDKMKDESSGFRERYVKMMEAAAEADKKWWDARREIDRQQAESAVQYKIHNDHVLDGINKITDAYNNMKAAMSAALADQNSLIDAQTRYFEAVMKGQGATALEIEQMHIKEERQKQEAENIEKANQIIATRDSAAAHQTAADQASQTVESSQGKLGEAITRSGAAKTAVSVAEATFEEAKKKERDAAAVNAEIAAKVRDNGPFTPDYLKKAQAQAKQTLDDAKKTVDDDEDRLKEKEAEAGMAGAALEIAKADLEAAIKKRDTEADTARIMREQADQAERLLKAHQGSQQAQNRIDDARIREEQRNALTDPNQIRIAHENIPDARKDIKTALQNAQNVINNLPDAKNHIDTLLNAVNVLTAAMLNAHSTEWDRVELQKKVQTLEDLIRQVQANQTYNRTPF